MLSDQIVSVMSNYHVPVNILLTLLCWSRVAQVESGVPQPIITLHDGHIGLYDSLLETEYTGKLETGHLSRVK